MSLPDQEIDTPRSATLACRGMIGVAALFALGAVPVAGQDAPPDSVRAVADTLAADSLAADTLQVQAEPDSVSADSVFFNLPELEGGAPAGWEAGVWTWDLAEIQAMAANTLAELVAEVPGVITLVGGDYGTPASFTAFGTGGGGYRIFRDGFEVYALDGGVVDLSRVGLGGIRRVRLERGLGELRIEMWSREYDDGRPYSLVEAGTGDLGTNIFRGTFTDPTALGGSVGLGLERTDTQGPNRAEVGNRTGSWLRYQLHRGDDAGIAIERRSMTSETDIEQYPSKVSRSDWSIRGRARLAEGLVGEVYTGKSTYEMSDIRDAYEREGGERSQRGVRLGLSRQGLWARGEYRTFGGDDLPGNRIDAAAGLNRAGIGGFATDLSRAAWDEETTTSTRLKAWTEPIGGVLSLFGSYESGTYGSRTLPLLDIEPAVDTTEMEPDTTEAEPFDPGRLFGITERTATRVGATLSWRGASVSGALLNVENDTIIPLGLALNRDAPFLEGAERKGWEVWASLPTPLEGLRLVGSLQQWDDPGPYMPEQIYRAAFVFRRTYLETGNFDWWWTIGVRGHDPMTLPIYGEDDEDGNPTLESAPFFQHWYARMQIRVLTVQVYVSWENLARRPNLQNYPGRVLPIMRTVYGLRWTMFN